MGVKTGDKARYNRTRRKKIARRVRARELRKELQAGAAPTTDESA